MTLKHFHLILLVSTGAFKVKTLNSRGKCSLICWLMCVRLCEDDDLVNLSQIANGTYLNTKFLALASC